MNGKWTCIHTVLSYSCRPLQMLRIICHIHTHSDTPMAYTVCSIQGFQTKVPQTIPVLSHTHIHTHMDISAIGSNLGFSMKLLTSQLVDDPALPPEPQLSIESTAHELRKKRLFFFFFTAFKSSLFILGSGSIFSTHKGRLHPSVYHLNSKYLEILFTGQEWKVTKAVR